MFCLYSGTGYKVFVVLRRVENIIGLQFMVHKTKSVIISICGGCFADMCLCVCRYSSVGVFCQWSGSGNSGGSR